MEKPRVHWDLNVGQSCKKYCATVKNRKSREPEIKRKAETEGIRKGHDVGMIVLCVACPNARISRAFGVDNVSFQCQAKLVNGKIYDKKGRNIGDVSG